MTHGARASHKGGGCGGTRRLRLRLRHRRHRYHRHRRRRRDRLLYNS